MSVVQDTYPLRFDVDYPEELDRFSTFFRLLFVIPIFIILALAVGSSTGVGGAGIAAAGFLVLAPLLMIMFRMKYPRWWFDWNLELLRFSARISVYLSLLRDEYPSTDEEQSIHLEMDYPNVEVDLNRWLPLVKWLLAIPHFVVLWFLGIAAIFAIILAWFAILFTGRYPRALFDFIVGFTRWGFRVQAYAFLMVTDRYPPFSLS